MNGKGILIYGNGDIYDGYFEDVFKNGHVVNEWSDG